LNPNSTAIFASRLLNGRPPIIFEDGEQSRDFTHVSDIVQGILLALESDSAVGHAVNLGTGRPTSVAQVAQVISAGMGLEIEPILIAPISATSPTASPTDPGARAVGFGRHDLRGRHGRFRRGCRTRRPRTRSTTVPGVAGLAR
jgi:nucleoside-diphosphate-sugar epimerase